MERNVEVRLRELRSRVSAVDPLLAFLVSTAVSSGLGVQYGLTLLVGGARIRGVPAEAQEFGEMLDRETSWYYEVMEADARRRDEVSTSWREIVEKITQWAPYSTFVEQEKSARENLFKELEELKINKLGDLVDLPDALIDDALQATTPAKAVTLKYAQVKEARGDWEDVGLLRVSLTQVEAWWIFRLSPPDDVEPFVDTHE